MASATNSKSDGRLKMAAIFLPAGDASSRFASCSECRYVQLIGACGLKGPSKITAACGPRITRWTNGTQPAALSSSLEMSPLTRNIGSGFDPAQCPTLFSALRRRRLSAAWNLPCLNPSPRPPSASSFATTTLHQLGVCARGNPITGMAKRAFDIQARCCQVHT